MVEVICKTVFGVVAVLCMTLVVLYWIDRDRR